MLGTIDTKSHFDLSPFATAQGISVLLQQISQSAGSVGTVYPAPKVLLSAPPALGEISNPWAAEEFRRAREKSQDLARHYRNLAEFLGIPFLDAGSLLSTDGIDGIHFSAENNRALGIALASWVRENLLA
jgi:lysophospholipase L1-like esterase